MQGGLIMTFTAKKLFLILGVIFLSAICVGCSNETSDGVLINLDDAYYLGKLDYEDLLVISEYHNTKKSNDKLEEKIQIKIKKSYLKMIGKESDVDEVEIANYYGVYDKCYVIMLTDNSSDLLPFVRVDYIANVEFTYSNSNVIMVWSEDSICDDEKIKLDYVKKYLIRDYPLANINDVQIENKIGIYNSALVLFATNSYDEYLTIKAKETIINYVFEYSNNNCALVYYNNCFYTLKEAYTNKILLIEHLDELIKRFPVSSGDGLELNGDPIS